MIKEAMVERKVICCDICGDVCTGKVAIVGFGDSRRGAPCLDKSYEIWGLNDAYEALPRYTRWFDIHDWDSRDKNSIKTHVSSTAKVQKFEAYARMKCPVYCQEEWPGIPNVVKYPLKEIQEKFCGGGKGYFTNQVSYMIALALYEGFDVIDLYGVDMAIDEEYTFQRPSVEYWVGVARGMGKEVFIPKGSSLLKTSFIYGFEQDKSIKALSAYKDRLKTLRDRKDKKLLAIEVAKEEYNQYIGAIDFAELLIKEQSNL